MTPSTSATSRAVSGVPGNLKTNSVQPYTGLPPTTMGSAVWVNSRMRSGSAFRSRTTRRVPFGRRSWPAPALIAPPSVISTSA